MAVSTYVNARGVTLSTASTNSFWAANSGSILDGDGVDDTFYIYWATNEVVLPAKHGIDTVVDGGWNMVYTLAAGVQNLVLTGSNEVVTGNALDNLIIAQSGNQTMSGGGGDDIFVDGTGTDMIIDPAGSGNDVIYSFKNGIDHVRLDYSSLTSFAAVKAAMTQVGADVVLNMGGGQTLTFRGEQVAAFTPSDVYLPMNTTGMKLTFDDEFNSFSGSASGKGTTWKTTYAWGNRTLSDEAEYYSDSSVGVNPFSIVNGVLDITAAPTNPASNPLGLPYTSGAITTEASFSQLYGYFEMRAELPSGAGFWPAFWLLPANGSWPPELDAMEQIGSQPSTDYVTAHTDVGGFNTSISSAVDVSNTSTGFHTYGVYWGPDYIRWYFDGQEIASTPTPADMNTPMYMLANLAVGAAGSWPGTPAAGATAEMQIDYIRAYAYTGSDPALTGSLPPVQATPATASLSTTTINFGTVHVGDTATRSLTVTNSATGADPDLLGGGFGAVAGPFTGSGSLQGGLTGGQSTALTLAISTATAGAVSGTATLALVSDDATTGTSAVATPGIALVGTVDNYAVASLSKTGGSGTFSQTGNAITINLGTILDFSTTAIDLALTNSAAGPADLLSASFAASGAGQFTNTGFSAVSGLAAGQSDTGLVISLSSQTAGTFTETIKLSPNGSNASGYWGSLATQTITITGTTTATTILPTGVEQIVAATGSTDVVTAAQVAAGVAIAGGGGINTLELQGGGTFNLNALSALSGIQTIDLQEGTGSATQTVTLRNGDPVAVTVLAAAGGAAGSIAINTGNDTAAIHLGTGTDTVTVGSAGQSITGGGHDTVYAAGGFLGGSATINGGGTGSQLDITSGGSITLGSGISNFGEVVLASTSGPATLTANAAANLQFVGDTGGGDTIVLGASTQSVIGGGPGELIKATAAFAGDRVSGLGANSKLEITTGGTITLNAATGGSSASDVLTVQLDQAAHLTLSAMQFVHAIGSSGADTLTAKASNQTLTGGGGADTLVGYSGGGDIFSDTLADLGSATIQGFMASDQIDVTDVAFSHAAYAYNATTGLLSVTDASHTASIHLTGIAALSGFSVTADQHGGSLIGFTGVTA